MYRERVANPPVPPKDNHEDAKAFLLMDLLELMNGIFHQCRCHYRLWHSGS